MDDGQSGDDARAVFIVQEDFAKRGERVEIPSHGMEASSQFVCLIWNRAARDVCSQTLKYPGSQPSRLWSDSVGVVESQRALEVKEPLLLPDLVADVCGFEVDGDFVVLK